MSRQAKKELLRNAKTYQTHYQIMPEETPKSISPRNKMDETSRGSLAWFGRQTHNLESTLGSDLYARPEVAGSNPAPGTKLTKSVLG